MKDIMIVILVVMFSFCCSIVIGDGASYIKAHPELDDRTRAAILQGRIIIGMTAEQVKASWGKPTGIRSHGPARTYSEEAVAKAKREGKRSSFIYEISRKRKGVFIQIKQIELVVIGDTFTRLGDATNYELLDISSGCIGISRNVRMFDMFGMIDSTFLKGNICFGMSTEEVNALWGEPEEKWRTPSPSGHKEKDSKKQEHWLYGFGMKHNDDRKIELIFEDNILRYLGGQTSTATVDLVHGSFRIRTFK